MELINREMVGEVSYFCFYLVVALSLISLIPLKYKALQLALPLNLFAFFLYNYFMPTAVNIRIDLVILLPLILLAAGASLLRRWCIKKKPA